MIRMRQIALGMGHQTLAQEQESTSTPAFPDVTPAPPQAGFMPPEKDCQHLSAREAAVSRHRPFLSAHPTELAPLTERTRKRSAFGEALLVLLGLATLLAVPAFAAYVAYAVTSRLVATMPSTVPPEAFGLPTDPEMLVVLVR